MMGNSIVKNQVYKCTIFIEYRINYSAEHRNGICFVDNEALSFKINVITESNMYFSHIATLCIYEVFVYKNILT